MVPYPGSSYARYGMYPSAIWGARCSPSTHWPSSSRASSRNRHAATLLSPLWIPPLHSTRLQRDPRAHDMGTRDRGHGTWATVWDKAMAPVQGGGRCSSSIRHAHPWLATVTLPTAPEGTEERLQQSALHIHPAHAFSVEPVSLATQHNMPPPTVQAHTTTATAPAPRGRGRRAMTADCA
jgi:hypothetical protein